MTARATALALALLCGTGIVAGQQPVFRSGTSAMTVNVFVTSDGQPVLGLTPSSFELRDNNVAQLVTSVSYERAPLSVTLVLEAGTNAGVLSRLDQAVARVIRGLQPDDRCSLITFGRRIEQVTGSLTTPVLIRRPADAGPTGQGADQEFAMNDAVIAALAAGPSAGRRQVVLLFTTQNDSASFLGWNDVQEAAWRSPAMIQHVRTTAALAAGRSGRAGASIAAAGMVSSDGLSQATGGSVRTARPGEDLGTVFLKALDDARMSYVLSYTPNNVKPGGWHEVLVKVKKGGYDVRARQGYFGG
jgi:VWFA-related protein